MTFSDSPALYPYLTAQDVLGVMSQEAHVVMGGFFAAVAGLLTPDARRKARADSVPSAHARPEPAHVQQGLRVRCSASGVRGEQPVTKKVLRPRRFVPNFIEDT
jgi:hypothetical protein